MVFLNTVSLLSRCVYIPSQDGRGWSYSVRLIWSQPEVYRPIVFFSIFCCFLMASLFYRQYFLRSYGWHLLGASLSHPRARHNISLAFLLPACQCWSWYIIKVDIRKSCGIIVHLLLRALLRTRLIPPRPAWEIKFMLRTTTNQPTYTLKHRRTLFYFHERMYSQKYIITVRLRVAAI